MTVLWSGAAGFSILPAFKQDPARCPLDNHQSERAFFLYYLRASVGSRIFCLVSGSLLSCLFDTYGQLMVEWGFTAWSPAFSLVYPCHASSKENRSPGIQQLRSQVCNAAKSKPAKVVGDTRSGPKWCWGCWLEMLGMMAFGHLSTRSHLNGSNQGWFL